MEKLIKIFENPQTPDEQKAKIVNELNESFDLLINCEGNQAILDYVLEVFVKYLKTTQCQFSESPTQKVRKSVLEMIHRLQNSDTIRQHVQTILVLVLNLIKEDNEDNVLVCLRIIIDFHKQYRPAFYPEIKDFLNYIHAIYCGLRNNMDKIFDPRLSRLDNINVNDIYTVTDKILPKGRNSFKVLQELPIILVLMYQLYRQHVHEVLVSFLPAILNTITLEPRREFRMMENFNKELFVDFMGAQIKTLAFLAYTIKTFSGVLIEIIEVHAKTLVDGMFSLLRLCMKESAHLRKELLVATRHILATNLRKYFVPSIELLFDESLLLGKGYTTHESLRPLAYSTLGDFIHIVRLELKFETLVKAVNLFSRNIHDETLPTAIHVMSIRLLLNLVDCIRNQRNEASPNTVLNERRDLLVNMLRVFILKFQTISKVQMPIIIQKWKIYQENLQNDKINPPKEFTSVDILPATISKLTSIGFTPSTNLTIAEFRLLVKLLITGVKTIAAGINSIDCENTQQQTAVMLKPQEVKNFIDFFNWSIESFYLYRINSSLVNGKITVNPTVQKEEKELLELFSGLFLNMTAQNFQEICTATIGFLIEKMLENQNLQVIINTFLSYRMTSPLFATVMVEYLLERMEEIGSSDIEKSNLYLKLFKLIFGSVGIFAVENEPMIRPYLQKIVLNSMEMAMRAEEPFNYFLLLRALFRSIGVGIFDMLYQEFLPLLPNLLDGLNRLQSGRHVQHMKDLFVELCLTVPVRLSSLLPFLPMLMDPLVSALNGSPSLVTQGLRTLELCVDNLQPDFFYDHIHPVRAELMQALWKALRNTDSSAMGAFRILGKFGGGNRNMLIEPQQLEHQHDKQSTSSCIFIVYGNRKIDFSVHKTILTAYETLQNSSVETSYVKDSWNVVRFYLASQVECNDDKVTLFNLLTHPSFIEGKFSLSSSITIQSSKHDETLRVALSAMFIAAAKKELHDSMQHTMITFVRHFILVAISQQAGPFQSAVLGAHYANPLIIFDALVEVFGNKEKEIATSCISVLNQILLTSTCVMGSKARACALPMMKYLADKLINLSYQDSWYEKKGACTALKYLCEEMSTSWLFKNIYSIVKAHLFVIRDLSGEVCCGTIDLAISNIEFILSKAVCSLCDGNFDPMSYEEYSKIFKTIINELVIQTSSPHKVVRQVAMKCLKQIAIQQKITVAALLEPFKSFFSDMIVFSPTKTYLRHQPLMTQIGILEANHFVTSLEPKLMRFDNLQFLNDVKIIIKCDDETMERYDAYKDAKQLPELRESAMKVLVSWHYIYHKQHYDTDKVKNINFCDEAFVTLFKAMETYPNLQETAFDCLKRLTVECKEKCETGWPIQNSFLESLGDYMSWTTNSIKRLSYYSLLFPKVFTEKTCDQLLEIVKKLLQNSITLNKDQNYLKIAKTEEPELKIAAIIDLFHKIPAASSKYVIPVIRLVMAAEEAISLETSSPFREPMVKFLIRYPEEAINFLTTDEVMKNCQYNRLTIHLLKHKDGNNFKILMENRAGRLKELILKEKTVFRDGVMQISPVDDLEIQHQAVLIVFTLIGLNSQWLPSQMVIVNALNHLWSNELQNNMETEITNDFWHLVAKILLHYFEYNPSDINLLFQLLRGFDLRTVPDFQFLREFLHNIGENYTVDWKRNAFFLFIESYKNPMISTELKIKMLTYVLIPSFAVSFERGEDQRLIKGLVADEETNVISVFINKVVSPFMNTKESDDGLRIALLQFGCLLVEKASAYIHSNKKEDIKIMTTFGYSSLLNSKNYWDPTAIYNGHLLLSHIIATITNKKSWQEVVFKVFHSLLKAHAIEARHIVRQTLDVFMPIMPLKLSESNLSLINVTKSVIIKDGYAILQISHVFQVIIRHHAIYYPVRHQLIQNMINSMQRLESSNSYDYRKLAIDIAEVIINWELRRIREEAESSEETVNDNSKRSLSDLLQNSKKLAVGEYSPQPSTSSVSSSQQAETISKPIDWIHCKAVLNFLFDLLFMLSEQISQNPSAPNTTSPNEIICKMSSNLLKKVLKKDVWINRDSNIQFPRLVKVFEDQSKVTTICNFLEIFIYILDELEPNKLLQLFSKFRAGLASCVTSSTTKVLRLMSTFLSKVIKLFPFADYINRDELQFLYQTVMKTIRNGLEVYDKDAQTQTSLFFGTFLILKTAFSSDPDYFKMFVDKFSKFVMLLKNEHLAANNSQQTNATTTTPNIELTKEMLLQSLHLLKFQISHMKPEVRKYFIHNILMELTEKSNDARVLKTIVQVMESWFKLKIPDQEPTMREKILLMQKLTHHVEQRFSQDQQLNLQFLELVLFIYTDDELNQIELTSKLDQAFISGLRCSIPEIRKKFFAFFNDAVDKNIFDRLLYILTTKAWTSISHHYWIKQSVELLMLSTVSDGISTNSKLLPSIASGLNYTTTEDARSFYQHSEVNDVLNFEETGEDADLNDSNFELLLQNRENFITRIINSHMKLVQANRGVKTTDFLSSAVQLCHHDSKLAESVWLKMFPKLWSTLSDDQRMELGKEILPFLSSGTQINTKETSFNAINTFTDALTLCEPSIFIPPGSMRSLSKNNNLYHRMALVAEDMHKEFSQVVAQTENEFDSDGENEDAETLNDIFVNLAQMYSSLCEEDMWAGLWEKHAKYPDTNLAIFYERLGHFEEAQIIYESVLLKSKQEISNGAVATDIFNEIQLWENHWIRCTKELNEWPILTTFAQNNKDKQAFLLIESSWRNCDWNLMKQGLMKAEQLTSKQSNYKLSLFNGFMSMLGMKENSTILNKHVEGCSNICLLEWKKLPSIISQMHIPILQTAQQIMELQEASQIHQDLVRKQTLQFHDMKSIIKTWRNRLPTVSDDLIHWNDVLTWRQQHYQIIIESGGGANTNVLNLGCQASAQALIKMGKIARKHELLSVAQNSLQGIEKISSVPINDCFQKIIQSVKCDIHLSTTTDDPTAHLTDALKIIDSVNVDLFTNTESKALLNAYRGHVLTYLNRSSEANKSFSAAVELNDNSNKSWGLYGEYFEILFTRNPKLIQHGVSTMTCYLHASRDLSETKTRKYLSKIIWLLTYDEARPEMLKAFENYMLGVQTINWLPWIPQLLNCLVQYDTEVIITLLNQVAKIFPQAIYFSIRSIFLMLKLEQRERHKCLEQAKTQQGEHIEQAGSSQPTKSTQAMWRCSKIMQLVREVHPTIVFSLEGILEQMVAKTEPEGIRWFRENAFEENLHHLKQGLVKFHVIAFENRLLINEATTTQQTLNFIKKLVANFSQVSENMNEAVLQDPVFSKLKMQFAIGFDFVQPENNKLLDSIKRMKACIRIMEAKVRSLPKFFVIEEKYRFLSNFTQKTAEIDLPGELLLPRHSHYNVKIAKFLPKVEIVQKYNTSPRRLFIRGTNGKVYPYLVVNDSGMIDARREERILQLIRMLNSYLIKSKETSRRFLNITVPKVIPVLPQMRLVEDNPSSISLLDVFKKHCYLNKIDHDAPISKYYERLAEIQLRGAQTNHVTLRDVFKDIQTNLIPKNVLKDWATRTFQSATDYWTFRKMFTLQLSLCCVLEYAFHLTRLNADMMYLHQDSGLVNVSYFKFDLDDVTGQFNQARPVPFRLTPNIVEFLTNIGITGPLQASVIATAQCFLQPNFQVSSILKTILRDEIIAIFRRQFLATRPIDLNEDISIDKSYSDVSSEKIIQTVNKAVGEIMERLETLIHFNPGDEMSKTVKLIHKAKSQDYLAYMDPAFFPWM